VPSLGGNNCCGTPTPAGPMDQRPIEGRRDVLLYTSDFLTEEVEATGPVKVVLYASSDAVDTDFVAKLVDVYPTARATTWRRASCGRAIATAVAKPSLLTPGQVYAWRSISWAPRSPSGRDTGSAST
jgi:putative CocE/NonD family hydrolase